MDAYESMEALAVFLGLRVALNPDRNIENGYHDYVFQTEAGSYVRSASNRRGETALLGFDLFGRELSAIRGSAAKPSFNAPRNFRQEFGIFLYELEFQFLDGEILNLKVDDDDLTYSVWLHIPQTEEKRKLVTFTFAR